MPGKNGFLEFRRGRGFCEECGPTLCRSGLGLESPGIAIRARSLVITLKGVLKASAGRT